MSDVAEAGPRYRRLLRFFRAVVAARWIVLAFWGALLVPSVWYALQVVSDNTLDQLIVQTDPEYKNAKAFEKVFGAGEYVVVLVEAKDPYDPAVLARVEALEVNLRGIRCTLAATESCVSANSAFGIFKLGKAYTEPGATPEQAAEFKAFAAGTKLLSTQGLVGPTFLAIPVVMDVSGRASRIEALEALRKVVAPVEQNLAPFTGLRVVGQPLVNDFLDRETRNYGAKCFAGFAVFVIILCLWLYRSVATLIAFITCIGTNAALIVGWIGLTGGTFTMVSQLVPMTVMITCMSCLVYIHSRFVDVPEGTSDVWEHQLFALSNKFLACAASIFATAAGFAALYVSNIRPIREMGLWVAIGLIFTFGIVFTLFPALQRILNTPTEQKKKVAGKWLVQLAQWLPGWSYRWRWVLVPGALLLSAAGGVAILGFPGLVSPMKLHTAAIDYIDRDSQLYKDTKWFEQNLTGLTVTEVWIKRKDSVPEEKATLALLDPAMIRGLDRFQSAIERDPDVGTAIGLVSTIKLAQYIAGQPEAIPTDTEALESLTDLLPTLAEKDPGVARFTDQGPPDAEGKRTAIFGQTHIAVITHITDHADLTALRSRIDAMWADAIAKEPKLGELLEIRTLGLGPLQAKLANDLAPTLVESFWITVAVIFITFLLVFRSGAARIMAMIPSIFAILVMFLFMRLTGMHLSIATILIASTVLGTSENDQIHFFYHFVEGSRGPGKTTEDGLRHTLIVSGRAILFATLINAAGFAAFAFSALPPLFEFGILSGVAFLLSALADFTALPAALWIVFREKPDSVKAREAAQSGS